MAFKVEMLKPVKLNDWMGMNTAAQEKPDNL